MVCSSISGIVLIGNVVSFLQIASALLNNLRRNLTPLLDPEDIAYDCIAELYERDSTGAFIQLQAYFDGEHIANESDQSPTGCDPLRHLPAMEHGFFEE